MFKFHRDSHQQPQQFQPQFNSNFLTQYAAATQNHSLLHQLTNMQNVGGGQISSNFQDYPEEKFSRKVFVGGLPPDIDEDEIVTHFRRYGNLIVDWPHKAESKSYFPPKGYAFLIFQEERSVQDLIETCVMEEGKLYLVVSSPSMKDKPVQIRPWCLGDSDFVLDGSQPLDPRKTIFVGGVPRPLKARTFFCLVDKFYF
jgi:RNA recognition motif-containing protein